MASNGGVRKMYGNGDSNGEMSSQTFLNALSNLSQDFSRKLDESERDTRRQIDAISTKIDTAFTARDVELKRITERLLEGKQAPWPLLISGLSVLVVVLGSLGALAYSPIAQRTSNVERAIEKMVDVSTANQIYVNSNFVTKAELDQRGDRGKEDRERTNRAIEAIQNNIFTRDVHKQHWDNIDSNIAATNLRLDSAKMDLQRQIDSIQKSLGDTYTTRDALLENKRRMDKLEDLQRQFLEKSSRSTQQDDPL